MSNDTSATMTSAAAAATDSPLAFVPLMLYNNTPSETGGDSLVEDLTIFYDVSGHCVVGGGWGLWRNLNEQRLTIECLVLRREGILRG
jgi:hypothetical protein